MSWYYLMQKDEHYVIATRTNWEEFKSYGFHRVIGFSGQRYAVEFHTIKALWHDEVLHKTKKDAKLWRIAMGMEAQFAKKTATHKELLRRQAMERKKNRIFPKVGMQITFDKASWLACPHCHRMYNDCRLTTNDEKQVNEDKKIYAIRLGCCTEFKCNADKNKRFQLVRPISSGKKPTPKTEYTVRFEEYHIKW